MKLATGGESNLDRDGRPGVALKHLECLTELPIAWIPAFAGMTKPRCARVGGHPGNPFLSPVPSHMMIRPIQLEIQPIVED